MIRSLLAILIVFSAFAAAAHDYYFSFAEMEYNPITRKIEMTVTVTTHDFERAMESHRHSIENIATLSDTEFDAIAAYINQHLSLHSGEQTSDFQLIGHEVELNGTTHFYFESAEIELENELSVTYDLLMETFEEQQNKLTFYYEDRTLTAAFTKIDQTQIIYLENP